MTPADLAEFTAVLAKTWYFYDKTPTGDDVANWFELMEEFSLAAVTVAFKRHLTDPHHGTYPPKPADIFRHLETRFSLTGRPVL